MPKITAITRQKKRDSYYSVYIDGKYVFSLSDLELSTSGLRVGVELSELDIDNFTQASVCEKAYNQAIAYLSLRKRSRREMIDYLGRKDLNIKVINQVIERLEAAGLIDDMAFAMSWIADRKALKPRSRRFLEQELKSKGISGEALSLALQSFSQEDELEILDRVISKKISLSSYSERDKLITYLLSRGFHYDLIKQALERFSNVD